MRRRIRVETHIRDRVRAARQYVLTLPTLRVLPSCDGPTKTDKAWIEKAFSVFLNLKRYSLNP